jgi:putative PIN family toxin of toxin-antitoxin system
LKRQGVPRQAILKARATDIIALSRPVFEEIREVLERPKFRRYLSNHDRQEILMLLAGAAVWVKPVSVVTDCRDRRDNMYLELAAAAEADFLLSSDQDLLVLDPWRNVRIISPAAYLARP